MKQIKSIAFVIIGIILASATGIWAANGLINGVYTADGFTIGGVSINEFSTDTAFTGDSDTALPTEKAVEAYVAASAGVTAYDDIGDPDGDGAGSDWIARTYKNSLACAKCVSKSNLPNNTYKPFPSVGLVEISVGDRLYTTIESDGTNALTVEFGDFNLHRL